MNGQSAFVVLFLAVGILLGWFAKSLYFQLIENSNWESSNSIANIECYDSGQCTMILNHKYLSHFYHQNTTGSMLPYLRNGCYIISIEPENIVIGDTVFTHDLWMYGDGVHHRVIGLCDGGYVLGGDANGYDDGCVPKDKIKAKTVVIC